MDPRLPNLVVIGAMKCATTSLHHYLDLHPEIAMSRERGLNAFLEEKLCRGQEWYAAHFDASAPVRGDTSPRYTNSPLDPGVAERMRASLPDARLVYVVRDPLDRLVSHYTHYLASGYEQRPAAEALLDLAQGPERNPYLCRSLYWMQLSHYLALYPEEQIHVLYYEELRDRRREALRGLFRFLAVDDGFDTPEFERVHHETRRKRRLRPNGRRLRRLLDPALAHMQQDARERVAAWLTRPFSAAVERPALDARTEGRLRELLRRDSEQLQEFVGRSAGWRF